ncbi:MAG: hypothetical protein ACQER9_04095 [Nanobdellota archaeon]
MKRNAKEKDAEKCLKLSQQEGDKNWTLDDFKKSVQNENSIFFVYEIKNEILGYILGFVVPTKTDEANIHEQELIIIKEERKSALN